eukprot:TRINITY_DN2772_c0_g1_i2.p1 TRINITY_DN2772_c0_g1~~TRINITY_DN2772_c0_g1_i2.p1  ORF type:complete len:479 (-),score=126.04 TRINITY_DN2772_c0_g1_i2:77-1513(-)
MCRWLVYIGDESVLLEDLVTNPKHSMIQQSFANPFLPWIKEAPSQRLNHRVNGDGFGVGWYHQEKENPCVFVSVKPSWNDLNLKRLSEAIESKCVFAHVRAASPGSAIVENNCHPFQFGRILFMHNGCIFNFDKWKKRLITHHLNDEIFQKINGSTDSEFAAALFVQNLKGGTDIPHTGQALKEALLQAMLQILKLTAESDENPGASSLNIAVTNGEIVIATRFRNSNTDEPPSLYYTKKPRYECKEATSSRRRSFCETESFHSVVIASEPLSYNEEDWALVPKNHLVIITKSHKVILEPINFDKSLFFDLPPPPLSTSDPAAFLASKAIKRLSRRLPEEIGTPKMFQHHSVEMDRCKHCSGRSIGVFTQDVGKKDDNCFSSRALVIKEGETFQFGDQKLSGELSLSPKKEERKLQKKEKLDMDSNVQRQSINRSPEASLERTFTFQFTLKVENTHVFMIGAILLLILAFTIAHCSFR